MYIENLKEECGIFGIFGHPDAASLTALVWRSEHPDGTQITILGLEKLLIVNFFIKYCMFI